MRQGRLDAMFGRISNSKAAANNGSSKNKQQQQQQQQQQAGSKAAAAAASKPASEPLSRKRKADGDDGDDDGGKENAAAAAAAGDAAAAAAALVSNPDAAPAAAAAAPAAKPRSSSRPTQAFLDLGQRDFGASACAACGMVYARGREDDEALHRAHCAAGAAGVKFPGWAAERVLLSDATGRLLLVLPTDPPAHVKKVAEAAALVERLHALTPGWLLAGERWRAFLYVSPARRVIGLLVVEPLKAAYWAAPLRAGGEQAESQPAPAHGAAGGGPAAAAAAGEQQQQQQQQQRGIWRGLHGTTSTSGARSASKGSDRCGGGGEGGGGGAEPARGAESCPAALPRARTAASPQQQPAPPAAGPPEPAKAAAAGRLTVDRARPRRAALGARMVWVAPEARRRGVATRMLDAARANTVPCYVAPRAAVAFSRPNEAGAALAAAYCRPVAPPSAAAAGDGDGEGAGGWLIYGV